MPSSDLMGIVSSMTEENQAALTAMLAALRERGLAILAFVRGRPSHSFLYQPCDKDEIRVCQTMPCRISLR